VVEQGLKHTDVSNSSSKYPLSITHNSASTQKYFSSILDLIFLHILLNFVSPQESAVGPPPPAPNVGVTLATIRDIVLHLLSGDLMLSPEVLLEELLRVYKTFERHASFRGQNCSSLTPLCVST